MYKTGEFKSLEEFIEQENNLTVNVSDANYSGDYKAVSIFVAVVIIILLVAKKFNK